MAVCALPLNQFMLHAVAWVRMIEDVICSRKWERIVIPDLPDDEVSGMALAHLV